ncbi:MAG: radical SAM/SPASM domain-containing protein [Candidatus Aenigmatarchaeota archaeon]
MGLRVKFKFKESHKDEPVLPSNYELKSVFYVITNKCNYECFFCAQEGGESKENELNTQEALNLIRESADTDVKKIIISGGEPTLRKDFDEIIREIKENEMLTKLCTNGYILDKKIDMLTRNEVSTIQFSLNSIDKDIYFKMSPKAPSDAFEKSMENVDLLRDFPGHTVISSVPLKMNQRVLPEFMDFCYEKEVETFSLYKPVPTGRGMKTKNKFLTEPEFLDSMDKLLQRFYEYDDKWLVEVEQPYGRFSKIVKKWEDKIDFNFSGCKAGKLFVAVTPDGYVTPCPGLDMPEFYVGNVRKESIKDIWEKQKNWKYFRENNEIKKECDCEHYDECLGGCRIIAYVENGSITSKDPYCKYWI